MPEAPQPAPQPQATNTAPKSHDWKKVGLTVLIILVVAGLIVAAYWFLVLNKSSDESDLTGPVPKATTKTATESAKESTPSAEKDETKDWKTYTDGRFEFKYPKDWVVENKSHPSIEAYSVMVQKKEGSSFDYSVYFAVNTPTSPDLGPGGTSQNISTKKLATNGTTMEFGEWVRNDDGRWYLFGGDLKLYIQAFSIKSPSTELRLDIEGIITSFKISN